MYFSDYPMFCHIQDLLNCDILYMYYIIYVELPNDVFVCPLTLFQNLQLTDSVDWVNGHPPIAEPPCGFRGEKCISEYNTSCLRCYDVADGSIYINCYRSNLTFTCDLLSFLFNSKTTFVSVNVC